MIGRTAFRFGMAAAILFSIGTIGAAHAHDRPAYTNFHAYKGACGGTYVAAYSYGRAPYYRVDAVPGRYVWRTRRVRVGSIRRGRGRGTVAYRTVKQRILVRPVRYRVRKRTAAGRYTARPIVIRGARRLRGIHRRRAC